MQRIRGGMKAAAVLLGLGVAGFLPCAAYAGEPVAGIDVGAAIPTGKFRQAAKVGGGIAPFAGYRWGDSVTLSLLGQPQVVAFPSDNDSDDDITSLFSFTAGPRVSLVDEHSEVYVGAQGGVYTGLSGNGRSTAEGYNLAAGYNYQFTSGDSLGLFLRRDQAWLGAASHQDTQLNFLVMGLGYRHTFKAPALVAEAPPPPAPEPVPVPVKQKLVLRGVNFDTDKAAIRADAQPVLDTAAQTLKENPGVAIAVEGHTDNRAGEAHNQKLSVRRAEAVRTYLAKKGVESTRMAVAGFGESKPIASNDTADGRAQNRRVELRVTTEP